jgi:MFS family permease
MSTEATSVAGATRHSYREFRYGWGVVLAAALGIGLGMSPLPFYTIGVFVGPLAAEFGWSVGQIMVGMPILTIGALVMAPLAGFIADRLGVRRVALASVVLFSLSMMMFSLGTGSLALFYFNWFLVAFLGAGTLPITWTRAVNRWFFERRGLALGCTLVATGFFGSNAKLFASWLIEAVGWRGAYIGVGLLPLLITFPIAWLLFRDVDDPKVAAKVAELRAGGHPDAVARPGGMTIWMALRDWRFWLLAYAFVPVSFAVGGPIPNLENLLGSKGFERGDAVVLASLIGYAVIVGRLLGGWAIDKFWAPAVAAVCLSLPAIACLVLRQPEPAFVTAALCIALLGLAAGVEYDLMAFLVSRYFGMAHYATIYGSLYGFFALGAGLGPLYFGRVFGQTGSYDSPLALSAVLFLAGALPLLLLGRYRTFVSPDRA